jgi:pimeloyl-ACP methyl ester carboxylesterase
MPRFTLSTARACAASLLVASTVGACTDAPTAPLPAAPRAPSAQVISNTSDADWAQRISGKTGDGSVYAMFVPHNWNGDVVYYAHGFADVAAPIALPDNVDGLRNDLGARGYAVAYSSFSENGFAVKDGIQRTQQLRGLFSGATGLNPNRSYLIGQSLGGAVALAIAEQHASQFAGVMPVCGMVGGSRAQTQYIGNVRSLFDALFPNVGVVGSTLVMPTNVNVNTQIVGPAQAAVFGSAAGVGKLVAMAMSPQTPLPTNAFNNYPMMFQSLATALGFHARGINDILDRTNGATPFDNLNTVYTSPLWNLPTQTAVNAAVSRYSIEPSAENYLSHNWTPSGNLQIPTLTLRNALDPVMPSFHQAALEAAANAAGTSNNLVSKIAATEYGHCVWGAGEVAANFDKLALWVTQGIKP